MAKTGGFKLAIEKRRNYYFELAATGIGFLILSFLVYSIYFATKQMALLFSPQTNALPPAAKFHLEQAKNLSRVTDKNRTDFSEAVISPLSTATGTASTTSIF